MTKPEDNWDDYYSPIIQLRREEAFALWGKMEEDGVTSETFLGLDFVLFSKNKKDLEDLSVHLVKNYQIKIEQGKNDYWFLKGTTKPYGIKLSRESFLKWIDFMCQLSQSHACVFSIWSAEAPSLKKEWTNEG